MKTTLDVERLISCRKALGITKMEAAKRISVSQPAYVRYESGSRTPSIQVISEMAKVFNTSVDYLTGKTSQKSPDYIIVNKSDQPILFELIEECNDLDESKIEHLKLYLESLK